MRLDLGAIAKGYAVDEALRVLKKHDITRALISGGGDMAALDAPPGKKGWRVELAGASTNSMPAEFVLLKNHALATSGDVFQHVEIAGVRYSHIVDPRTGIGLTNRSMVVVIAPNCAAADSLSTAISVLGPDAGMPLAKWKNACVRIGSEVGGRIAVRQSSCFVGRLE